MACDHILLFQEFMFSMDISFECVYCRYFLGTLNCMNVYIVDIFSGTLNFMNSTHFSRTCIFRDFFVGFFGVSVMAWFQTLPSASCLADRLPGRT